MTPMPFLRRRVAACLLASVLAAPAFAADPAPPLPAWEQLTPAQREQLIAPLRERWNAAPEQRARMLAHARRWKELSPEQRSRARHGMDRWQDMTPEQRARMRAVFAHVRTLPDADRRAFMARWHAMSDEQKRAWVQANPAPPRTR